MGLHIGLIGCGMVGKVHLSEYFSNPLISTVSLAESDSYQREELSGKYPFKTVTSNYKDLFDDGTVNVVDICLPHDLHYPVVMAAFQSKKHVILEKPISNTIAEAEEMIGASITSHKRFFVALNERFMPVHQFVKEKLHENAIGKVVMANMTIAGSELERMNIPDHWKGTYGRAGGGALADSGTHIIDLALDWFGYPRDIQCTMGRFVVCPVNKADDTGSILMRYLDKIVVIQVTYAAAGQPWSESRTIWGENGSIHLQIDSHDPIRMWQNNEQISVRVDHDPDTWWQDSVKAAVHHAIECIVNEKPFSVTPENARDVLQVIRTAYSIAELS